MISGHRRPLSFDALISFCQGISIILIPSLGLEIRSFFDPRHTDWIWSLIFVPCIGTSLIAMRIYPRVISVIGNHSTYRIGIIANVLFFVFLYLFTCLPPETGIYLLLPAMVFQGIGFAWITAAINMRVAVYFPSNLHSGLSGVHSLFCIGAFFCPLYVEGLRHIGHWKYACIAPAVVLILTAVFLDPVCGKADNPEYKKRPVYRFEKFIYLLIFLYGIAEAILGNWAAVFIGEVKGFPSSVVSSALSVFWIFMAAGRLSGSFFARRISRILLHAVYTFTALAGACLILISIKPWHAVAAYAVTGLGCSVFFPFSTSLAAHANREMDEHVSAGAITALLAGIGISGPAAGVLLNAGSLQVDSLFIASGFIFLCLTVFVCSLLILRRDQLK